VTEGSCCAQIWQKVAAFLHIVDRDALVHDLRENIRASRYCKLDPIALPNHFDLIGLVLQVVLPEWCVQKADAAIVLITSKVTGANSLSENGIPSRKDQRSGTACGS
jgi:hypothetical protein